MRPVARTTALCLLLVAASGACGKTKVAVVTPGDAAIGGGQDGGQDNVHPAGDGQVSGGDVVSAEGCPVTPDARPPGTPTWTSVSGLKNPQSWYATPIAAYIAEAVLTYQNGNGGWPKNIDMTYRPGIDATASPQNSKSMIDNDATTTQIRFLAFSHASWPLCERYSASFNAGMNYLFEAQYAASGGWPQVFPLETANYSRHITYNDNAMVHVMQVMRDIAYQAPLFSFVPDDMMIRATNALRKGVECMLNTQIKVDGKKTGWCAQHDEVTLLPANARAYELSSQSGKEGAQVLAFLMTLDLSRDDVPKSAVVDAVEAAVQFYDSVKIMGVHYIQSANDAGVSDSWIELNPNAGPLWARFYDLEAPFKPFFCDRNGIKVYTLAEVGVERRGGYAWYVTDPQSILHASYPAWVTRWSIGRNVLGGGVGVDAAVAAGVVDGG